MLAQRTYGNNTEAVTTAVVKEIRVKMLTLKILVELNSKLL